MTIKTVSLKLLRIAGWMIAGVFASVIASVIAFIVFFPIFRSYFFNEITWDLSKDQVINLNKKLSADELCLYEVGTSGILETQRRYPAYRDGSSEVLHGSTTYWSVVAIHHKEKTFDQYLVRDSVVKLVEGGACSNSLLLRTERSRGGSDFWFAFARGESQGSNSQ